MSERVLGLDIGIASCGWGVIDAEAGAIVATGVRCFDAPLVDKYGKPKSAVRRDARGQRRVIRRRRQRMNAIRRLLAEAGLLASSDSQALHVAAREVAPPSPWTLRAAALERKLTAAECAVVLGHIARHRGFRSNAKTVAGNAADEASKMKRDMARTSEKLAQYRSFGDMVANDPAFAARKRNRDEDFSLTPYRNDLEKEVSAIFAAQRRFGVTAMTEDLHQRFAKIAFTQRPLQDSEKLVGACPFEPGEMRAARRAPSFEMFRFLSRLTALELSVGRSTRRLEPHEITAAAAKFGETKTFTFKALRKLLDIDPNARFSAPETDRAGKDLDVVARTGGAAYGTKTLRDILGEAAWASLRKTPERLDRVAEILSFREDLDRIREGLAETGVETAIIDRLVEAAEAGEFKEFTRAGHISAKACRAIIPYLMEGLVYSEACARAGYDHAARPQTSLKDVNSPVTRRAFLETIKQVKAILREHGPIDYVHIELARDVGKSAEERTKLRDGLEKRTALKESGRKDASNILGRRATDDELLRYELALEQQWKCVYTGDPIACDGFAANDARYQVDHILPWSRFGDDSFLNKTLCTAKANQDKRGRTPFEWYSSDKPEADWISFEARVEGLKEVKGRKKRNYLLKNAEAVEERFKARNLTDTQWVTRLLADELRRMFPPRPERRKGDVEERRVFTRPGAITSKLRRAWGLDGLKTDADGKRLPDDRHHAVDALVLAATTESLLQRMTREIQKREREGRADDIFHVGQPWPGFRMDVEKSVYGENGVGGVFVSRAERRRARGKAHDATIKQVREVDGKKSVYIRKNVLDLKESDLNLIPVPSPYGKIADPQKLRDEMVETLRAWLALSPAERKKTPPLSPKGDPIRKVRLRSTDKVALEINGGTVDRGEMARVDVFRKKNAKGKWEFYVVPIYPHQIATMATPPMNYVRGKANEAGWPEIGAEFEFLWALNPMDYLELTKSNGEVVEGYFRGLDINTAAVKLSKFYSNKEIIKSQGVKTLSSLRKFRIDRMGRKTEVLREVRTWRGKACT
ncbi:MAG: type II CRISPR RNA-guided endonuclease Cas9 [Parvularculaceae bacterium]